MPINPICPLWTQSAMRTLEEEKIFEDQEIYLTEPFRVSKGLVFRNCTITSEKAQIFASDHLTIENCEFLILEGKFLTILGDASIRIRNSKFIVPFAAYDLISAPDATDILIGNCIFERGVTVLPLPAPLLTMKNDPRPMLDVRNGKVRNCTFRSVVPKIRAREFDETIFHNCFTVQCGCDDGDSMIDRCEFIDCYSVTIEDGELRNSTLVRVDELYLFRSAASDCTFHKVICESGSFISLEDSEVSNCTFEDVTLKNSSYFCDAAGASLVENCRFTNCCAENSGRDLFYAEDVVGKLRKRTVEYELVDKSTCIGLDEIRELDECREKSE